eukprot:scaffold194308_cov30-Tisochrysis_lutea.AAC.2
MVRTKARLPRAWPSWRRRPLPPVLATSHCHERYGRAQARPWWRNLMHRQQNRRRRLAVARARWREDRCATGSARPCRYPNCSSPQKRLACHRQTQQWPHSRGLLAQAPAQEPWGREPRQGPSWPRGEGRPDGWTVCRGRQR